MATDVLETPEEVKNQKFKNVWNELGKWNFLESIQNVRIRGIRNWIFLAFILCGVLLAYMASEKNDDSEADNVFVSDAMMEAILKVEQKLVRALNNYADELQNKVDVIRSGLAQMRTPTEIHDINAEEFLSNPLNSFPMLRRIKTEWRAWEKYLNKYIGRDHIHSIHGILDVVPNFDLLETLDCFEILREIYDIQPADWMQGKLLDKKYDKKFSSLDAYTMAFLLTKRQNYTAANDWFVASLNTYEDCELYSFMSFNRSLIRRSYADNLLKLNLTEQALTVMNAACGCEAKGSWNLPQTNASNVLDQFPSESENDGSFQIRRCCRGEVKVDSSSQLHCYYNSSTNNFVRLAPFKVEQLYADPIVLLYHDIISDCEISELKRLSKGRLERSGTVAGVSPARTSENAWIGLDESRSVSVLKQRIEDFTGLYAKDDDLLVGNYAPGGLYRAHLDCLSVFDGGCNQRLMTVLLYLSNVDSGGATIFPELELSVFPQKGKALIWYNVRNDMQECDYRTLHMGCPIIVGTKWFAVQWIFHTQQAFRKPCFKNTTQTKYGEIPDP